MDESQCFLVALSGNERRTCKCCLAWRRMNIAPQFVANHQQLACLPAHFDRSSFENDIDDINKQMLSLQLDSVSKGQLASRLNLASLCAFLLLILAVVVALSSGYQTVAVCVFFIGAAIFAVLFYASHYLDHRAFKQADSDYQRCLQLLQELVDELNRSQKYALNGISFGLRNSDIKTAITATGGNGSVTTKYAYFPYIYAFVR